jgi:hypothetical protein
MAKSIHDVELGEMVGIAEAERLTGVSKATLRSWRTPEGKMRAKFRHYEGSSQQMWYRLADLELYAKSRGVELGRSTFKQGDAPNAIDAPLGNVITEAERGALIHIGKITTENYYEGWYGDLQRAYGGSSIFSKKLREQQAHFHSLRTGIPVAEIKHLTRSLHIQSDPITRLSNNEQFWIGTVAAFRRILCELKGYDLTDEQILSVPFGDIPPLTEHNKTN